MCKWAENSGLCLNARKCKYMIFGSLYSQGTLKLDGLSLALGDCTIERVHQFKYLGVLLDDTLSWRPHGRFSTAKVYRALRSLSYLRRCLDGNTRRLLVCSLCTLHLDYCSSAFSLLDARTASPLQVSLNACIRFITDVPRFHSVSPYRRKLRFLSTFNRCLLFSLTILFKLLHSQFPPSLYLTISPTLHSAHRVGRSHSKLNLLVPVAKSKWRMNSFSVGVVKKWNGLPERLKHSPSVAVFKRSLSAFLLASET